MILFFLLVIFFCLVMKVAKNNIEYAFIIYTVVLLFVTIYCQNNFCGKKIHKDRVTLI